ncbi:uncharacterized protein LOC144770942 isoform X1 [Lissotriton helveticus]
MSQRPSDEVSFQEASACFSEEEWGLLREWQKELYMNVMKEIHQALISLGPLIVSTVSSLRAKEKEERFSLAGQDWEQKLRISQPREYPFVNTEVSLRKEEPVSISIDHRGAPVEERSTSPNSVTEFEVVTFHIKDEEETFVMDHRDTMRLGSPSGGESMSRQKQVGDSIKSSERRRIKTMVPQSMNKEANPRHQAWSGSYQEPRGEQTSQRESTFSNPAHYSSPGISPSLGRSNTYDECNNNIPNTAEHPSRYTGAELDTSYSLSRDSPRLMRPNQRRRPYPCTECEKIFYYKSHLIKHHRTHSGEKPFMCHFCHKRFNRKDYLDGHIRIHTGERPYKCTVCDKSFTWKSHLNEHQRKHAGSKKSKIAN